MNESEQNALLIRIDQKVDNIIDDVKEFKIRAKEIDILYTTTAVHTEQLKTHNRFIWANITASLSLITGLILLSFKMLYVK